MKTIKQYLNFLNDKKSLIGLSDWVVLLNGDFKDMDEYATVEFDIYEKTLKVDLSVKFESVDVRRKRNILMHELVHAKIGIYNEEIKELIRVREEHLVNDLTKGYENMW